MIANLITWMFRNISFRKQSDYANGIILDDAFIGVLRDHFDKGRWDGDIVNQVSNHTGLPCNLEEIRGYYRHAYRELVVGEDMGVCIAKFKRSVVAQFYMNRDQLSAVTNPYQEIAGSSPAGRLTS